jgi:pimeloyl-ACP methyl ester carboxylesterase
MLYYKTFDHPTSAEWVTFVHGAGGSSSIWYKQIREYKKHFNVLLLDLRGHGQSKTLPKLLKRYTFTTITQDVIEVLDHLKLRSSHFVGISLGTIIIRELAELAPDRVRSMVMGGAIMKMNVKSQILMKLGFWFKSVLPYMLLYKFFAWIIMPRRQHKESRSLFVREAKKLYQKEFIKWFRMASEVNPLLRFFREKDQGIPTLYIMGDQDHMFLPSIRKITAEHQNSTLHVIPDCGHVVNVDQPQVFNDVTIAYIQSCKLGKVS